MGTWRSLRLASKLNRNPVSRQAPDLLAVGSNPAVPILPYTFYKTHNFAPDIKVY